MSAALGPFWFLVTAIAGWMCRRQQEVIAYLVEENRILREQMSNGRLQLNDDQRRRLAAKAKKLERKTLEQVATIAALDTLLRWHGKLIAKNKSTSMCPTLGRPFDRSGHLCFGCADGRRKSVLGLSADTGSIVQSRPRSGTQYDPEHSEKAGASAINCW